MASRVLNLYPEMAPQNSRAPGYGKIKAVHYGTPGIKTPLVSIAGPVRAARFVTTTANPTGYIYTLINSTLYRIDINGTATACTGAAIPSIGNAMMTSNRTQLAVLANGTSYYVASGAPTTVVLINDADYPAAGASSIDVLDGYGIWTQANSDQLFISALNDFSSIDALDFATAESAPDGLVRVLVDHRLAWFYGEATVEPWVNTGDALNPFQRIPNSIMQIGCAATLSPATLGDVGMFFLGSDRIIYRNRGPQAVRISTNEVEEAIRTGTVSDARGFTYTMGGHQFYAITFPTLARSFVFDITTGFWHERQSTTVLTYAPWNVTCTVDAWGKVYAGTTDGNFGELDLDTYTEAGSAIRRVIHSTPFYADGDWAILDSVEVEMELGTGLSTGQGEDPQIMLRWSDDGGATWSNQRTKSFGVIGERYKRVIFRDLGMFRQRMLEFSISDPVKVSIYGMKYTPRLVA